MTSRRRALLQQAATVSGAALLNTPRAELALDQLGLLRARQPIAALPAYRPVPG